MTDDAINMQIGECGLLPFSLFVRLLPPPVVAKSNVNG